MSAPSFEEIRAILKENALARKKHDKKHDKEIQEIRKIQMETAQQMQETDRIVKNLTKDTKKLKHLFTNGWGALVESLVSGCLVRILRERNIEVTNILTNQPSYSDPSHKHCEVDIIARNGRELVVTEVKSNLEVRDVDHFLKTLSKFFLFFPEYKDKNLYGAVAYLKAQYGVDSYATKKGLFVIKAIGDSACITNDKNFRPKDFSSQSLNS